MQIIMYIREEIKQNKKIRLIQRQMKAPAEIAICKKLVQLFTSHVAGKDTVHEHNTKYGEDKSGNAVNDMNIVRRKPGADFTGKHYLTDVGT